MFSVCSSPGLLRAVVLVAHLRRPYYEPLAFSCGIASGTVIDLIAALSTWFEADEPHNSLGSFLGNQTPSSISRTSLVARPLAR